MLGCAAECPVHAAAMSECGAAQRRFSPIPAQQPHRELSLCFQKRIWQSVPTKLHLDSEGR